MCVTFLLNDQKATIDLFNWHLANGWAVVDRFDLGGSFIIMVKK